MTISYPDNFPIYDIPWMLTEIVTKFTKDISLCPIDIAWSIDMKCVILIGDPDEPSHELEFSYDNVRLISLLEWAWQGDNENQYNPEWSDTDIDIYDIQDEKETERLTSTLAKYCKEKHVTIQYCPTRPKD